MDTVLNWVNDHSIIRRVVLFVTLWMTWAAFQWAATFAYATSMSGVDAGAVIAAVTAPISMLQGFVFKVYAEGRRG